eukprot:364416-Chlamydomonas_euryale.AAC.12
MRTQHPPSPPRRHSTATLGTADPARRWTVSVHLQVIRDARVLLDKRGAARVVRLDARPAACLIQQVYRLVGQEAVSNVLLA